MTRKPWELPRGAVPRPAAGEWVTYQGERMPVLGPQRPPDPIRDAVDRLVREFDPGGYSLQCPVAGCGWHEHVPRMELDPEPAGVDEDGEVLVRIEGVPRSQVIEYLTAHVNVHAALSESGAVDVPLPVAPRAWPE